MKDRDLVVDCRIESRIARGNARNVPLQLQGLLFGFDSLFRYFRDWKSGEIAINDRLAKSAHPRFVQSPP